MQGTRYELQVKYKIHRKNVFGYRFIVYNYSSIHFVPSALYYILYTRHSILSKKS